MSQAKQIVQFLNFTAGFVTEATELTYPPNSSYDEDNCILSAKGNRRRRAGIDFETDYSLSSYTCTDTQLQTFAISTYNWSAVGGDGRLNFLIVQLGNTLHFYDIGVVPLSSGLKSFTINLNSYLAPSIADASTERISCAVGRGDLYIVSPLIKPLQVVYTASTNTIATTVVPIRMRDFDGVSDGLAVDTEPSTLSASHHYNLLNQGWFITPSGMDPLDIFHTESGVYPANNLQWYLSKKVAGARKSTGSTGTWGNGDNGEPDTVTLRKLAIGTTNAPRGHYILDPFYKDRSAVSHVSGISVQAENNRPNAVAFYAGRVVFGMKSDLYVSQVVTKDRSNAGKCYQESDPTSEDISDLIDSDGVVISIPEAGNVQALASVGQHLIVFATNGVWFVTGSADGGFKATDFVVAKITSLGAVSSRSIVNVEGVTIWFNETSILTIQVDNITGRPTAVSLSDAKIKTFYTDIGIDTKRYSACEYDIATQTLLWLYKDDDDAPVSSSPYFYNKALLLDMKLGAFYKFSISSLAANSPFIAGIFRTPVLNQATETFDIVSGTDSVLSSTDSVILDLPMPVGLATFIKYLTVVPTYADATNTITFSEFSNLDFTDWQKYDIINYTTEGADYDSYLETGFDLQNDAVRKKQAPYIIVHSKRTESGYYIDESSFVQYLTPSSLMLQARWDWTDNSSAGKWSQNKQVYREQRQFIPDESELTFEPGNILVTSRNKIRGSGKALQLRFSSESGKDFDLIGWGIVYTGNTDI